MPQESKGFSNVTLNRSVSGTVKNFCTLLLVLYNKSGLLGHTFLV